MLCSVTRNKSWLTETSGPLPDGDGRSCGADAGGSSPLFRTPAEVIHPSAAAHPGGPEDTSSPRDREPPQLASPPPSSAHLDQTANPWPRRYSRRTSWRLFVRTDGWSGADISVSGGHVVSWWDIITQWTLLSYQRAELEWDFRGSKSKAAEAATWRKSC